MTMTRTAPAARTAPAPAAAKDAEETEGGKRRRGEFVDTHGKTVDVRTFVDRIAQKELITKTSEARNAMQHVVQTATARLSETIMDLLQHAGRQQVSVDYVKSAIKIQYAQQPDIQTDLLAAIDVALANYDVYQDTH